MRCLLPLLAALWVSQAGAQSSGSFLNGSRDRSGFEAWYAALPEGDYKRGVLFWVNHRSIPSQATCTQSGYADDSNWMLGCQEAQQRFAPWDAARRADPQYRLGWNSYQTHAAVTQSLPAPSISPNIETAYQAAKGFSGELTVYENVSGVVREAFRCGLRSVDWAIHYNNFLEDKVRQSILEWRTNSDNKVVYDNLTQDLLREAGDRGLFDLSIPSSAADCVSLGSSEQLRLMDEVVRTTAAH